MSFSGTPIIIDIGSSEVRVGYSVEDKPSITFPNYIGEPKYNKILKTFNRYGEEIKDVFVGNDCSKYMGIIKLNYPAKHGSFSSERDISLIFNHIYNQLQFTPDQVKEHPVLITEPILNPKSNREKISEVLFEQFDTPGLFFASQPILSLFKESATTGTVLESGDGVTQVCSVYEGYSLPDSQIRNDYGGRDITEYLQHLLKKQGAHLNSDTEYLFVKEIKQTLCYSVGLSDFNLNYNKKSDLLGDYSSNPNKKIDEYKKFSILGDKRIDENKKIPLPDLKEIVIENEKSMASQILFMPSLIGKNCLGVHQMISASIGKVDNEYRNKLLSSIYFTGGNTLLKSFIDNVVIEFRKIMPKNSKIKFPNFKHKKEKELSWCWIGGKIVTSLGMFKDLWATQKDWQEKGKDIVFTNSI